MKIVRNRENGISKKKSITTEGFNKWKDVADGCKLHSSGSIYIICPQHIVLSHH